MKINVEMAFKTKPSGDLGTLPIFTTDIMFHTYKKRDTQDMTKKLTDSMQTRIFKSSLDAIKFEKFELSSDENKNVESWLKNCELVINLLAKDKGFFKIFLLAYKHKFKIEIIVPSNGIPLALSNDTNEFMKSVKGKRILRKLAKK